MKKLLNAIVFVTAFAGCNLFSINVANGQGPIINIPDANFKAYLLSNFDANSDGNIDSTEAANVVGSINVSGLSIADLTGIEAFTSLDSLSCNNNQLISLNVSANTSLRFLSCVFNALTSLNVSGVTTLTSLFCYFNQLTGLDLSSITSLTEVNFYANNLTNLDVSANTALTSLDCSYNSLTSLDLSSNTALTVLNCSNNSLMDLNVKNGNYLNVISFYTVGNPNLACIQVDSVAYSTAHWLYIDTTSSFSTNCPLGIEDFVSYDEIAVYPNPVTDALNIFTKEQETQIILYDIFSRKCLQQAFKTSTIVNTGQLTNGIYFYELRNQRGVIKTGKVIK